MTRTVLMEVPLSLAVRVADLLDEHESVARAQPDPAPEGERAFVPQQGPWSQDEVELLCVRLLERKYDLILDLLDFAAARAGEWVLPPSERATSPYHVRNQLSALTKLIKKTFDGRSYWPMEYKRAEDSAFYYRLSPEVAAWWRAAREAERAQP